MTPEDSRYNMEIVEDETMLLCLDLNGKGLANGEIAGGLLQVMSYFARGVENKDVRETMADVLESFANHLRTKAPQQLDLELLIRPGSPLQEACYNALINLHLSSAQCQDNPGRINNKKNLRGPVA